MTTHCAQKFSQLFFGAAIRVITPALFLMVFATSIVVAQTRAYVTNQADDTVAVIDPATNTVVATIPVGNAPTSVAVTPDGDFAYVTNQLGASVSVIGAATNTVVATVPVGSGPFGIAITPNGAFAYVVNLSGTVSVISTASNTVTATISGLGGVPQTIAITPNGTFAYVTIISGTVRVIDTATNTVAATIPVGGATSAIAITPNGAFAYVTHTVPSQVSVISTATNTVVATIPMGGPVAFRVAITPNGAFAYVAKNDSTVSVIDTATNTVVAIVPVGVNPLGMAFNGTFVYVVNRQSNSVSVIDTATNTVVATIPVGNIPIDIAFPVRTPDDDCALNALYSVIDGPLGQRNDFTGTVGGKFTVGANVLVDKLGFEDQLLDGLASSHQVGLWDSSGTLLASVTVQSGTGSLLIGNWRYETLPTPVVLTAGSTYIIGAQVTNGGDKWTDTGFSSIDFAINGGFSPGSPPNVFLSSSFGFPVQDGTLAALRWAPANLLFTSCPTTLLIAQVQDLITAGALTQNQGDGLIAKLNEIKTKIDNGQTSSACNQLNSFINQVNALINNGSLTPAQGQVLINAANALQASNGCGGEPAG